MTYDSATSTVPTIVLNDGNSIPALGFGVFQVPNEDTYDAVTHALNAGYRSIDTAKVYDNEAGVGRAIADSGLPRHELFVTTKLWNDDQGYDAARKAFDASLVRLGLDYVDLYLIHWPMAGKSLFVDSFRALQQIKKDGKARSIGVSNFTQAHLETLIAEAGEVPAVNQIELHPGFSQSDLRAFHVGHGIATEAWAPLGQGAALGSETIEEIAQAQGVSPAQVVIRWHLQIGNIVIPKSVTPERIASNFDVFGFELTPDQINAIGALDDSDIAGRIGGDPDTFG